MNTLTMHGSLNVKFNILSCFKQEGSVEHSTPDQTRGHYGRNALPLVPAALQNQELKE